MWIARLTRIDRLFSCIKQLPWAIASMDSIYYCFVRYTIRSNCSVVYRANYKERIADYNRINLPLSKNTRIS